jgi:tetratricopeptide (TPR) repeat protein
MKPIEGKITQCIKWRGERPIQTKEAVKKTNLILDQNHENLVKNNYFCSSHLRANIRFGFFLFFLFFLICPVVAYTCSTDLLVCANSDCQKGHYNDCLDEANTVLSIDPNSVTAWIDKGIALDGLGQYQEAMEAYNQALSIDPKNGFAEWYKQQDSGRISQVITTAPIVVVTTSSPKSSANYWVDQSDSFCKQGQYNDCLDATNKALTIEPNNALAWNNRGVALDGLTRYPEALEAYDKALSINSNYALAQNNRNIVIRKIPTTYSSTTRPTVIPTTTPYPAELSNNADAWIAQAQRAIQDNSQYDQSAAKQELLRAQSYRNKNEYANAINSAQNAYALANEGEQKKKLFFFFTAFVGLIIIISLILYDRRRCLATLSLSVNAPDIYEGDNALVTVKTDITGKFKELTCSLSLRSGQIKEVTHPGTQVVNYGVLPVGTYEVSTQCKVKKIRYGDITEAASTTFRVKERVPEVSIEPQQLTCLEGDSASLKVRITNTSPFTAIFDHFTLASQESKEIAYSVDTGTTGSVQRTEKISFRNEQGRQFERNISIRYSVIPVRPEISADSKPVECYETEPASAQVTVKNISNHDAIFRDFTLRPGESRGIDVPLNTSKPGKQNLKYSLEFRDKLDRANKKDVTITFEVKPIEPLLQCDVTSLECIEGDECVAEIMLTNTSRFDAIFPDFNLGPKEKNPIRIPLNTAKPGRQTGSYPIEFKNKLGVMFKKDITIPYNVKPVEPVLDSQIEIPECIEGQDATAHITLKNISAFDAIFQEFTLKSGESRNIEVLLDTLNTGHLIFNHTIEMKNSLGREFTGSFTAKYYVTPVVPVIDVTVDAPDAYEGDAAAAKLTLVNTSTFDAIFDAFTLRPDNSTVQEIPLNSSSVGYKTVTYTLEFASTLGKRFTKDVKILYSVNPVPRPSLSLVADLMENTEGFIRIEAVNSSGIALQEFRVWLESPKDFDVERRELKLETFNPGERRTLSLKAKSPYGGDYSVTVKATWIVHGKEREQQMAGIVVVNSPVAASFHPPASGTIPPQAQLSQSPQDIKAAKARAPAERPGAVPPSNSVVPLPSVKPGIKCQICLSEFSSAEPGAVKCPHCGNEFHYRCITKWVNKNGTCPICKKELKV